MVNSRALFLALLLSAPLLTGAEGGCSSATDHTDDDAPNPDPATLPFEDTFNGGLIQWRQTPFNPNHLMANGNPLPSMEVGSASMLPTGGLTGRSFDVSKGFVIEADVYWQPSTAQSTAPSVVWIGLSDEDDPTGTAGVAAGMLIDDDGLVHFQVNGVDIGSWGTLGASVWHRLSTTIRADRVVEFRIDGVLRLTGGSLDSWYLDQPLEACGTGYPQRPRFDNVEARRP